MEKEKKLKQDFLVKEIIKNEYDPELFANFLKNEKIDGEEINNWNYGELISLVNVFKKLNIYDENKNKEFQLKELDLVY